MSFDLSQWRGQTVQVYFNVYNDGLGGTAAMFLDDVSLATCTGGVTVVPTGGVTVGSGIRHTDRLSDGHANSHARLRGCLIVNDAFNNGLANWQG